MKYVLIVALLLIALLGILQCPEKVQHKGSGYPVVRVVDGDTFVCRTENGDEKIRLIGVDTPESVHPNKGVEYFGKEASAYLKKMLEGQSVYLEYDSENNANGHKDRYGRVIAYAYRATDSLFVNAEIIRQGYGHAYTRFPFRYMEDFLKYERDARTQSRGLWQEEQSQEITENDSLVYVKPGNKKYHRQDCRYATEGAMSLPKSEAIAKGFSPCKICKPE